jgi:hypothetical protein
LGVEAILLPVLGVQARMSTSAARRVGGKKYFMENTKNEVI